MTPALVAAAALVAPDLGDIMDASGIDRSHCCQLDLFDALADRNAQAAQEEREWE